VIRPLAWLGGPDGRLSFGKVVLLLVVAQFVRANQVPDAASLGVIFGYAYMRFRKTYRNRGQETPPPASNTEDAPLSRPPE
jgi:hypothetical protein